MPLDRPCPQPVARRGATLLVFTLDAAAERARRRLLPGRPLVVVGSDALGLEPSRVAGPMPI